MKSRKSFWAMEDAGNPVTVEVNVMCLRVMLSSALTPGRMLEQLGDMLKVNMQYTVPGATEGIVGWGT